MTTKKLEIKNPCGKKWDEMKLMQNGRYCGSCNHIIHDFSEMSNEELLQMLKSGKHSCGRFVKEQMGLVYAVYQPKTDRKKYWAGIAAGIIAGMLQVSISYSQAPVIHKQHVLGNQTNKPIDTNIIKETGYTKLNLKFKILDGETITPITNAKVELFGKTQFTDSLGNVSFEANATMDVNKPYLLTIEARNYSVKKQEIKIIDCVSTTRLTLYRKKKNQNTEYIVGFF